LGEGGAAGGRRGERTARREDGIGFGDGAARGQPASAWGRAARREEGVGFEDGGARLGEASACGAAGLGDGGGGEFSASRNIRRRVLLRTSMICRNC
jgi:hypothetical protein